VSNRKIGEDEVASLGRTVQVGHARSRNTSQDGRVGSARSLHTTMSERASMLETGVEKEIGIIVECDILACFKVVALNDSEFDDGRGIDGSTVTVGC
jgi:hypothetical protein